MDKLNIQLLFCCIMAVQIPLYNVYFYVTGESAICTTRSTGSIVTDCGIRGPLGFINIIYTFMNMYNVICALMTLAFNVRCPKKDNGIYYTASVTPIMTAFIAYSFYTLHNHTDCMIVESSLWLLTFIISILESVLIFYRYILMIQSLYSMYKTNKRLRKLIVIDSNGNESNVLPTDSTQTTSSDNNTSTVARVDQEERHDMDNSQNLEVVITDQAEN